MSRHFLLSSDARTLSLATVFGLTDTEAELAFQKLRWADTEGAPVCPACNSPDAYNCRRSSGAMRFRCRGCQKDFSITSGTIFASLKRPLRLYLAAIVIFCNEHKGKSMLAMSRDLDLSYKAAFVLCHKMREAMAAGMRGCLIGGEGKVVEIDGAHFGGYVKPANASNQRIDRRIARNLTEGARPSWLFVNEAAASCRQSSSPKLEQRVFSWHASAAAPSCTQTRRPPGTLCIPCSRYCGLITSRPTH